MGYALLTLFVFFNYLHIKQTTTLYLKPPSHNLTRLRLKIEMKNAPSFLGYSRLNAEITAQATDHREQIDLSTPHPPRQPHEPLCNNLRSPNQWPSPSHLPTFRPVFESYLQKMSTISLFFTSLIAEALELPSNAFAKYFDEDQQHKLKIVKYPDLAELGLPAGTKSGQGVGPHKDSDLTSYLLQASEHRGLQVRNTRGEWIDCPPVDGTLVVAIGQGMEALTKGICRSTTHRVVSPLAGSGARYSIPFFQGVSPSARFESVDVPAGVREEKRRMLEREGAVERDEVEFTFREGRYQSHGEATLMNRIKSHPDVGERWYPELLAQIRREQQEERLAKGQGVQV